MMLPVLTAAAAAALPAPVLVEQDLARAERNALTVIGGDARASRDPAELINLGIDSARRGEAAQARTLFEKAYWAREWVELETVKGAWVDSRTLARRAIAMLDAGAFAPASRLARN